MTSEPGKQTIEIDILFPTIQALKASLPIENLDKCINNIIKKKKIKTRFKNNKKKKKKKKNQMEMIFTKNG